MKLSQGFPIRSRCRGRWHVIQSGCRRRGGRHVPGLRAQAPCSSRRRAVDRLAAGRLRSEEHTSELQSLMRISYAVFCLKNKKKQKTNKHKPYKCKRE